MGDLLDEVKDHEAEKTQKWGDKKNKEESLVARGELQWDTVARQILGGESVAIGGGEPTSLKPSPTSTVSGMSDVEIISDPTSGSSKKRSAREHFLMNLVMDHENNKLDLEQKMFELQSKKSSRDRFEVRSTTANSDTA